MSHIVVKVSSLKLRKGIVKDLPFPGAQLTGVGAMPAKSARSMVLHADDTNTTALSDTAPIQSWETAPVQTRKDILTGKLPIQLVC